MNSTALQNGKPADSLNVSSNQDAKSASRWTDSDRQSFVRDTKLMQEEVRQKGANRARRFNLGKPKVKACA